MGVLQAAISKQTRRGGGHATLFLGSELPGARVCHRQSPGTEAELTTGGEGDKESKFPRAAGGGGAREAGAREGGGSR